MKRWRWKNALAVLAALVWILLAAPTRAGTDSPAPLGINDGPDGFDPIGAVHRLPGAVMDDGIPFGYVNVPGFIIIIPFIERGRPPVQDPFGDERRFNRKECATGGCNTEWILRQLRWRQVSDNETQRYCPQWDQAWCARNTPNRGECDRCVERQYYRNTNTTMRERGHAYCALKFANYEGGELVACLTREASF